MDQTRKNGPGDQDGVVNVFQSSIDSIWQWNAERKRINHQQLKNQFLPQSERLSRAAKLGRQDIVDAQSVWLRKEWLELGAEIELLLQSYEREASPTAYVTREVLGDLSKRVLDELASELHADWMERRHVREWVSRGQEYCSQIHNMLQAQMIPTDALEQGCRKLCEHLQNYPSLHSPI